jgi:hypothetical protein
LWNGMFLILGLEFRVRLFNRMQISYEFFSPVKIVLEQTMPLASDLLTFFAFSCKESNKAP